MLMPSLAPPGLAEASNPYAFLSETRLHVASNVPYLPGFFGELGRQSPIPLNAPA